MPKTEGMITVENGYRVAFRSFGSGDRTLLALHGGPGISGRSLDRLAEVGGNEFTVVLYDQLGGGESDWPDDPKLWTVERFVREVETVRDALDLGVVTLFGHSWGGMLAMAYALENPQNIDALVLSNTFAAAKHYLLDIADMRASMGASVHAMMLQRENADQFEEPDYTAAIRELYSRHMRRSTPFERTRSLQEFQETVEAHAEPTGPAAALWGPHEFKATGPAARVDLTDRIHEIEVPTLILCGWYDLLSPERCSRPLAHAIPDNEYVIFGNSSHLTIREKEADAYLGVIRDFLRRRVLKQKGSPTDETIAS